MITGPVRAGAAPPSRLAAAVRDLRRQAESVPAGTVSASMYETAQVARWARWLDGHPGRISALAAWQPSFPPGGYAVVPLLSVIDALLALPAVVLRTDPIRTALHRLLPQLHDRLAQCREPLPDTIAVELIVPALLDRITARLATHPAPSGAMADYLQDLHHRYGGLMPVVSPITYFERAWSITTLAGAADRAELARLGTPLAAALGPGGAPSGPDLLPDGDDTA